MSLKTYCFKVNSYNQAVEVIKISKKNKIKPIILISYYLINGFGIDWLIELKDLLLDKFKNNDFQIFTETKKNYALFINLVQYKIDYLSVNGNKETMKRLNQIANLNKVVINPSFSIVDLSKSKNVILKLNKLYNKI